MTAYRCIAPIDDAAQQLCGARATTTRIVDDLVCHLCAAHAAELDREQSEDLMTTFSITNRSSGLCIGDYAGRDADDAIDAMARDAGYDSQAHAASALGTTVAALRADLIVVEVAS